MKVPLESEVGLFFLLLQRLYDHTCFLRVVYLEDEFESPSWLEVHEHGFDVDPLGRQTFRRVGERARPVLDAHGNDRCFAGFKPVAVEYGHRGFGVVHHEAEVAFVGVFSKGEAADVHPRFREEPGDLGKRPHPIFNGEEQFRRYDQQTLDGILTGPL